MLLASCGSSERALSWSIRFEDESLSARATLLRGRILEGGCDSGVILYSADQDRQGEGMIVTPPSLPPGTYSFFGEAQDEECRAYARGCTEVELPSEGMTVVVTLRESEELTLCGARECENGRCSSCESDDDCAECLVCDPATRGCVPDGDGTACQEGTGMCRGGSCCAGCWDGTRCQGGGVIEACGAGGSTCQECVCPATTCTDGECVIAEPVQQADAGDLHACAVTSNGNLWCWGDNMRGELGIGERDNTSALPMRVGSSSDWRMVTTGENFSCAIRNDGSLWCWGDNGFRQLGSDTLGLSEVPLRIGNDSDWRMVRAGRFSATVCGLRGDSLYCWGRDTRGQLGVGGTGDAMTPDPEKSRSTPTQVGPADVWSFVSVGNTHTCAVRTNGSLWCWGNAEQGRLGTGDTMDQLFPVQVGTDLDWVTVAPGLDHTCATKTDSTLWCWGRNSVGALGLGDNETRMMPTEVSGFADVAEVVSGNQATCAIQQDGSETSLYCWGTNARGLLGLGTVASALTPFQVDERVDWLPGTLSIGFTFSCAGHADGSLDCFGENDMGQLGQGNTEPSSTPTGVCIR